MEQTPLQQLIERLKNLETAEENVAALIAYKISSAAAESLLVDEQRFIDRIKNNYYTTVSKVEDKTKYKGYLHNEK